MKRFSLKDVSPAKSFSKAMYLDSQFIITAPEMPLTKGMLKTIDKWGFPEVFSDGELSGAAEAPQQVRKKDSIKVDPSTIGDIDKVQEAELFCSNFEKYIIALIQP